MIKNFGARMSKKIGIALIAIAISMVLIVNFVLGGFNYLFNSYADFSLNQKGLPIILGIIIPILFFGVGFYQYRKPISQSALEKKLRKEKEKQIEDERRALELETLKAQRASVATEGVSAQPTPVTKEVVTKEIVKVRCRYCGRLYIETAERCPNCGGTN